MKVSVELTLNSKDTLSRFLADVERRAFKMAKFASRNTDEALDLVQETMFEFVRRYSARPEGEWKALFYRILQSRMTDWHRRTTVRKRFLWPGWVEGMGKKTRRIPFRTLRTRQAQTLTIRLYAGRI